MFIFCIILCCLTVENIDAILNGITRFEAPGRTIVLGYDNHDNQSLSDDQKAVAKTQADQIRSHFSDYTLYAELPYGDGEGDGDFLSLLKQRESVINLENRGLGLIAMAVLRNRIVGRPCPDAQKITLNHLAMHYKNELESVKDAYYRIPNCQWAHSQIMRLNESRTQLNSMLADELITPEQSVVKLYDVREPLPLLNHVSDIWCTLFDLTAFHTVYKKAQENKGNHLLCVGGAHAERLSSWLKDNLNNEYKMVYNRSNTMLKGTQERVSAYPLQEIEFKKGAGLLWPGVLGSLYGYAQKYTSCCSRPIH